MFNRQKIAAAALATLALGFVGIATASTASASKADDKFIAILEDGGLSIKDPEIAAQAGQAVCAALDKGATPAQLVSELVAQDFSKQDANVIIEASVTAYCPEYADVLDA